MTAKSHDTGAGRIALMAGTFDPFTTGHASIVARGLGLFDRIVIAIGTNPDKPGAVAGAEARRDAIAAHYAADSRVKVITYAGLTVDACRREGARFMLRGVRSTIDFEYERNLADVNRNISGIETVLLYAEPQLAMVSSSMVRELRAHGVDTSAWVVAG